MRKAELMGISTDIFPVDTSDTSSSVDGRRKHKQPALTADFVNYYLGKDQNRIFFSKKNNYFAVFVLFFFSSYFFVNRQIGIFFHFWSETLLPNIQNVNDFSF